MPESLLLQMAIALALGFLVGLQRQRAQSEIAGIRTFPLITLTGLMTAVLAGWAGGWVLGAGLICLTALLSVANLIRLREGTAGEGITTEVAALAMFLIGAVLATGRMVEPVVAGAVVALLLHWKDSLHTFAERMGSADFNALMQMALIAFVILPILPDRTYGPYQVINPYGIWTMVVLIVGISMAGYVAFKLFGEKAGAPMAGLLGGLISSTATSVSYARRSATAPARSAAAAVVILLASTVAFGRVIGELAVVAPGVLPETVGPLLAMLAWMAVISGVLYTRGVTSGPAEMDDHEPPSDLKPALVFGALYGLVLLAVAFAEDRFGSSGLYLVAAISGLTDMDAITLSTAQLMKDGGSVSTDVGWRVILLAGLTNLAFKGGVVLSLGAVELRRRIAPAFGAALVGGALIFWFWP